MSNLTKLAVHLKVKHMAGKHPQKTHAGSRGSSGIDKLAKSPKFLDAKDMDPNAVANVTAALQKMREDDGEVGVKLVKHLTEHMTDDFEFDNITVSATRKPHEYLIEASVRNRATGNQEGAISRIINTKHKYAVNELDAAYNTSAVTDFTKSPTDKLFKSNNYQVVDVEDYHAGKLPRD